MRLIPRAALVIGMVAGANVATAQAPPTVSLIGTWRVSRGMVGPATQMQGRNDPKAWLGMTARFEATRVTGPGVLNCRDAKYEPTNVPPEGMFQGTLPAPALTAAQSIGVNAFPVAGTRFSCDNGVYEFHHADANSVLVQVDNVIWTFSRSPGTSAEPTSPAGVVQRFLEQHFAGDMGFDRTTVAARRTWLTDALRMQIARYFAKPKPADEVPIINGDPFTNSQEYPTRFVVMTATTSASEAIVPVRMIDGFRTQTIRFVLQRQAGVWRINDMRYEEGASFRTLIT